MKTPQSLRLSLRDLFWLILAVGMGLGWYLDHRRVRELHELMNFVDDMELPPSADQHYAYRTTLSRRGRSFFVEVYRADALEPPHESTAFPESPPAN
jgi:hypothetical protein